MSVPEQAAAPRSRLVQRFMLGALIAGALAVGPFAGAGGAADTVTGVAGANPVVTNGGFEAGNLSGWTAGGVLPPVVTQAQHHSGSYAALLGASSGPEPNGDSSIVQTITAPSSYPLLSFWYWPSTADTVAHDWQEAQIRDTSGTTLVRVIKVASNAHAWRHVTFDLTPYAGRTVQLYFNDHEDGAGNLTYMYLDDVWVIARTPPLTRVSSDPYTNSSSQHATEVEPDTYSHGSTLVSVFQAGRFSDGGSDDIGWATTTNGGATWTHGFLPGITTYQGNGPWARVSDPSVGYDAKHGVWLAAGLDIDSTATGRGVSVNRSTDGVTWSNPVQAVSTTSVFFDKSWIACDSTSASPHYGNCYIEYDDNTNGNRVQMLTSTDGGLTWSAAQPTADTASGLGGQPLVQPNGTVIVPYLADGASQIRSFASTDGGVTWGSSVLVSAEHDHGVAGNMRTSPLPTAEIDSAGTIYVAWQDCRFRSGCGSNDIVMSTSADGATWTAVKRIPIDATSSSVDHFIPGLAVDAGTSGATAHVGLYYYYYPVASCSTCQLYVGELSSANGGGTWTSATRLAGPMSLTELALTNQGYMVGDYMSASFLGGRVWSVFAAGIPGTGGSLNEAMYTPVGGLKT